MADTVFELDMAHGKQSFGRRSRLSLAQDWQEVRNDPWSLAAGGVGLLLITTLMLAHACCFGFESDVIQTFGVICSGPV